MVLTHWGWVTHICVSMLIIVGSDNGLSPDRRQAIIWTNDGILLIGSLGTNFSEILFTIYKFSFRKMLLKMSSGKWRPSCLGLNVLNTWSLMRGKINICNALPAKWTKFFTVMGLFCYFLKELFNCRIVFTEHIKVICRSRRSPDLSVLINQAMWPTGGIACFNWTRHCEIWPELYNDSQKDSEM